MRTKQVDSIDDPKIRREQKQLLFPLFRLNTILIKNLVSISPSPMLIWVSQWSQCFKIRVAQHWGGRRHISGGETVWSINLVIFPENSRETVSVSMIYDEYCSLTCGSPGLPVAGGLHNVFLPRGFLVSGFTFSLISPLSSPCHSLPTGNLSPTTVWVLEAEFRLSVKHDPLHYQQVTLPNLNRHCLFD